MRAVDLIRKKRDNQVLLPGEIEWLVAGLANGEVPEYQWAAFLMAVLWRGLDAEETRALTKAMLDSGETVDLSSIPGKKVDKHSTGGVGDKTSLILAPIVAACGVPVPMVSGRGLGHTGGTLDKLESIPGFRVDVSLSEYQRIVAECGLVLIGQTPQIAPADKRIYALRDTTATVESIPLITASILSKKLAEGIDGLVLDVKTGDGAFMKSLADSRALAHSMCEIGRAMGKQVVALITRMDQPLGRAVGNAVEVAECVECLRGGGSDDLLDVSLALAAEMLVLGEKAADTQEGLRLCRAVIDDGSALARLRHVVMLQGGDTSVIDDPSRLPQAKHRLDVPAPRGGFVTRLSAYTVGIASMRLGAGRARVDSPIDHAVGVLVHKKLGDEVSKGEPLCTILANDETVARNDTLPLLQKAYAIGHECDEPPSLIVERL